MKKVLRKNLLIDFGQAIDQLGAQLIVTPDKYKRIDNLGVIVDVAKGCTLFTNDDVGKKVICSTFNREDARLNPATSKKFGLKGHWHFIVPESFIEAVIE